MKAKLSEMIFKKHKPERKDDNTMTLEHLFQNLSKCEFELQEIYEKLQNMLDDNKSKKLVSDLEEKVSKTLKVLHDVKIDTYKKNEKVPSFSEEREGCDIPEYDLSSEDTTDKRIEHILNYAEQLREYYLRVQNADIDRKTKHLFEKLAQFKKGQIGRLKEFKEVYASVI